MVARMTETKPPSVLYCNLPKKLVFRVFWRMPAVSSYSMSASFVSAMALTILLLIFLKSQGYYENVNVEHLHDIGKYMFAFSIFWTYLWFSQYMLIWYANVGEETVYFQYRRDNFPVLFFLNVGINFALPLLILVVVELEKWISRKRNPQF